MNLRLLLLSLCFLIYCAGCKEDDDLSINQCPNTDQSIAVNCAGEICPPILIYPENCSIFDYFPRELIYEWTSNSTADGIHYQLELHHSWHNQDNFGEWDDDSSNGSLIEVQDTVWIGNFVGAQPGRWRVRSIAEQDTSAWSTWYYFKFLR